MDYYKQIFKRKSFHLFKETEPMTNDDINKLNTFIGSTVSNQFELPEFGKSSTVSNEFVTQPELLVNHLSFSHIREIMVIDDAFERFFYETECIKCNWSVREAVQLFEVT